MTANDGFGPTLDDVIMKQFPVHPNLYPRSLCYLLSFLAGRLMIVRRTAVVTTGACEAPVTDNAVAASPACGGTTVILMIVGYLGTYSYAKIKACEGDRCPRIQMLGYLKKSRGIIKS